MGGLTAILPTSRRPVVCIAIRDDG